MTAMVFLLSSCSTEPANLDSIESSSDTSRIVPEVAQPNYSADELRQFEVAFNGLESMTDQVDGYTRYFRFSNRSDKAPIDAYPYIFQNEDSPPSLRLRFVYQGSSWLFFDEVTVSIDGENIDYSSLLGDLSRGTYGDGVKEVLVSYVSVDTLYKISNSDLTIIRFRGDDRNLDLTLTESQKATMKVLADAFIWMEYEADL